MTTAAIIQARTGSTRLPGKVLSDIGAMPMLGLVAARVARARHLDTVVVATTTASRDDAIVRFCTDNGIVVTRGSEDDVLARYYHAATECRADVIVRVTADCPFIDPAVIDDVVLAYQQGNLDYVSNVQPPTYPDGLDTEVFSMDALSRAMRLAALTSEREHVTPFIRNHPELFRIGNVECESDLSAMRWTVDEPADLEFARAVVARMGSGTFGFRDVVALLDAEPELARINGGIERNAGYTTSLEHDKLIDRDPEK